MFCLVLTACSSAPVVNDGQSSSSAASSVMADIMVDSPTADSVVKSPFTVNGTVRGTWFFEGSFPVFLLDDHGALIAQGFAASSEDWMTSDFIPLSATLTFETAAKSGPLELMKDNPSALPENAASVSIPVQFAP